MISLKEIKQMKVISEKKWSYILMEDERGWILTFMIGGPVEIDISVLLNPDEISLISKDLSRIEDLVESFKNNIDGISERRIVPSVWPS